MSSSGWTSGLAARRTFSRQNVWKVLSHTPSARSPMDFHHAGLHLVGGFIGESESENVFAREIRIGFEQSADTLDDHAGLAGAGAGDDEQRTIAVFDGALLGRVEGGGGRIMLGGHGSVGRLRYVTRFAGGESEANISRG